MLRDFAYALRLVFRTPLLSGLAVVALAFGIGAATALFSVVHGVLLRPLPYAAPDQLITVAASEERGADPAEAAGAFALTGAEAVGLRELTDVFSGVAVYESWQHSGQTRWALSGAATGERLRGALVDANFFEVTGLRTSLGRTFTSNEPETAAGVVISHRLWTRQFDRDQAVLGRLLRLDGVAAPVVGVLAPEARVTYPDETDVFVRRQPGVIPRAVSYGVLARLRAGISPQAADAAVARLAASGDDAVRPYLAVVPITAHLTGPVASGVWMVAAAGGVLCATAAANASLLLLIRSARRARDNSIRMAVGATRWHLLKQLAAEHVVIGVLGGAAGCLLTYLLHPMLLRLAPTSIPRLDESRVDGAALAFAVGVSAFAVAISGLAAYLALAQQDGNIVPSQLGTSVTSQKSAVRGRAVLLGAQAALLVVLLSTAALLLHSFINASRARLGFDPKGVVAVQLSPVVLRTPQALTTGTGTRVEWQQPAERLAQSVSELREQLRTRLRAGAVATVQAIPFERAPGSTYLPQGNGHSTPAAARVPAVAREVSESFFQVMGTPLLAGRPISRDDVAQRRRVMVLSKSLADHFFPDGQPVGRSVDWGDPYEVIGVAVDARWEHPERAGPGAFYVPVDPKQVGVQQLLIRSEMPVAQVAALVRSHLAAIDPLQPLDRVISIQEVVDRVMAERRFYATATSVFGVLALCLAAIAIFGGVAAAVTERLREFAIRLALGASPANVRWQAMRNALLPVAVGLAVGSGVNVYLARFIRRFLLGVTPTDLFTVSITAVVITCVALFAAWWPSSRATLVPPASVLRIE